MPPDLALELARTERAYVGYAYPGADREGAARAFVAQTARLEMIGASALDALERALVDRDANRRNAAARALAGMTTPEASARVADAFRRRDRPQLAASTLARLGRDAALDPAVLPRLDEVRPFERAALVRAQFRRRGPAAEALLPSILAGFESVVAEAAIVGIAGWGDPALLREVMSGPPMRGAANLPAALQPDDVRVDAAFFLALDGADDALSQLRAWAEERPSARAGRAVRHLAYLAHPDGVAPTGRLLGSRSRAARDGAFDAAAAYATPRLAPALLAIVEGRAGDDRDDARALLAELAGTDAPAETPTIRAALARLDPARRYRRGRPLTMAILAEELTTLDAGPRGSAAWNLRASSGDDHGFDLDDDLAGNLVAIAAWRARADDPAPIGDGGWAFRGAALPAPAA